MAKRATSTGGRSGRRPGELLALELPHGGLGRARPARSPAAWLHALDHDPRPPTAETRRLAEHYAGRAVKSGDRWVVLLGDHKPRRAFRRLREVELAAVACAPASAVITMPEAEALIADGVVPAQLQPLYDPAPDCTAVGAVRVREALEHLVDLDRAAVRFAAGTVTGVIAIPNTWA